MPVRTLLYVYFLISHKIKLPPRKRGGCHGRGCSVMHPKGAAGLTLFYLMGSLLTLFSVARMQHPASCIPPSGPWVSVPKSRGEKISRLWPLVATICPGSRPESVFLLLGDVVTPRQHQALRVFVFEQVDCFVENHLKSILHILARWERDLKGSGKKDDAVRCHTPQTAIPQGVKSPSPLQQRVFFIVSQFLWITVSDGHWSRRAAPPLADDRVICGLCKVHCFRGKKKNVAADFYDVSFSVGIFSYKWFISGRMQECQEINVSKPEQIKLICK